MSPFKEVGRISEGLNKGDFDWTIDICSEKILGEELDLVKSPTFSFASFPWHVEMKSANFSQQEYISLFLRKKYLKTHICVFFSMKMIFLGTELQNHKGPAIYSKTMHPWGFDKYILKKHLLNHWDKESKKCGHLIIRIGLRILVPHDEDPLLEIRLKGKEILSENYKEMLLHGKNHDLILNVKDKEFKAHRDIMQSRCPVFKSMLEHEMLEKKSGVVDIPDCDPSAFEQFLLYIYTGKLQILDESTMLGLYFIADKYDMENLKEECSTLIKGSLSVNGVCDVIKLALDHSDSSLLEFATKYFVRNAKDIYVTVEWMSLMKENPIQANELIIKTSSCCVRRSKDGASDFEKK